MPNSNQLVQAGRPGLSVVMPAYLEEENLRLLLPRIVAVLSTLGTSWELLVVDTMLPLDQTRSVAESVGARVFAREGGNSYGDAVRTGIARSSGERVIFMDADGSHPPEWIARLHAAALDQDLVIASRYVDQGFTENSKTLVLMSRVLNWSYSLVLGIQVKDVSNSFRLYRGDQLRALKLRCNDFDVVEEILIKLLRQNRNIHILEIPFTFKKRMFGESKRNLVLFALGYVFTLIKLRFLLDIGGQVLRFAVVGLAGTCISLVIFSVSTRYLGVPLNVGASLAFVVAATQNFIFNRTWTFRYEATVAPRFSSGWIKYLLVNLLGLGINLLVLNGVVGLWGARFGVLGQALGIVVGATSNFWMSRKFVFHAGADVAGRVAAPVHQSL